MNTPTSRTLLWLVVATFLLPLSAFAQKAPEGTATPPPSGGPLTPPGPPGRTMKSLEQVEPRTDLQVLYDLNHDGDEDDEQYEIVIRAAGSYYLSKNLLVSRPNGIIVRASGVTIDLNGFAVQKFLVGGNGIEIGEGAFAGILSHGCVVKNGSISGFAYGIRSVSSGVNFPRGGVFSGLHVSACSTKALEAGEDWLIEDCRVTDNSGDGIFSEKGGTIRDCVAARNGTAGGSNVGIRAGPGSSIIRCVASRNIVTHGILGLGNSKITECIASENTSDGTTSAGIGAGAGALLSRCLAHTNRSTAATSSPSTGAGFDLGGSTTIENCVAVANEGDGIQIDGDSFVRGNNCDGNGVSGDGAGIHVTAGDTRVEGNNVSDNDRGIDIDFAGSLIIKNSAAGNTVNYDIAANNVFGEIVDRRTPASAAFAGSAAPSSVATTDPWANFAY